MSARHFLDLAGATPVETDALLLTSRAVRDVARHRALGVVHGAAGLGKTFAVERALASLDPEWSPIWLAFPVRPTMRLIALELLAAITGADEPGDRFHLARRIKAELATAPRLVIVDEAQNLNRECIEFLRHLGEDPHRQGATLLVGGDGCWDVLSREPMLRSRVFRRVLFTPLRGDEVERHPRVPPHLRTRRRGADPFHRLLLRPRQLPQLGRVHPERGGPVRRGGPRDAR